MADPFELTEDERLPREEELALELVRLPPESPAFDDDSAFLPPEPPPPPLPPFAAVGTARTNAKTKATRMTERRCR